MIHLTINGKSFECPQERVSVAWLLEQVGRTTKDAELVREDTGETWCALSTEVELRDGDSFEVKARLDPPAREPGIHYTVNGEPQVTTKTPMTLEEILRVAGADAAIDLGQLESYYLDNVRTAERYEHLDDDVPIVDCDQFVALYAGPTPVA